MEQGSAEWHEARKGRITASVVGAILGHAPYATRDDIMRRMVRDWHGAEPEFTGNIATDHGKFYEDDARADYEIETENTVDRIGFITRDEWAGCSPDGLIGDDGGLEIKCPFGKRKMLPDEAFKPLSEQRHYYDQIQFSLWVTGRLWWHFWQWSPGHDGKTRFALNAVKPSPDWQEKNLPILQTFWQEYRDERQQDRAQQYLEPRRAEIDTMEASRLLAEYDELGEAIENATAKRKDVLASLVRLAGERDAKVCGRNLTQVKRAGAISYAKAIKALLPDADLEPWRGKETSFWVVK